VLIFILAAIATLIGAGLLAAALGRSASTAVYGGCVVVCLALAAMALWFLLNGVHPPQDLVLPIGLPWLSAHFRIDALSAWFMLVVDLGGAAAALFGIGYGRHEAEPMRVLPFFPVFLAAMNLVLIADDAFVFLLCWESMSLSSWLLVLANHRQPGNARAALVYLIMAIFGTACLLLAFGIMAGFEGAYGFAAIRAHPVSGWLGGLALVLILLGAGSKAGLVPLHAWLPLAHPAAPSHVSALMSGVMTKVAIYAVIRVMFDLSGRLPWGWGAILLTLGAASAVLGLLYALMQTDIKVLLAYSTVENIGIITIGLGLALVFKVNGLMSLSAVALAAALFHVLNHALFKSLLFFGSGAILVATGERDMERLGGLIHRLPRTAVLFLIGSAAISALPPFNGFVSEWLTFQAILNSPDLPQWALKFGVPLIGAALALAAALAAACFVRAYGITFLGRPRSDAAAKAHEVEGSMTAAMSILAILCVTLGLVPVLALMPISAVVQQLLATPFPGFADGVTATEWLYLVPLSATSSSYSGITVLLVVTAVTLAVVEGVHRRGSARIRRSPAWDCGFPDPRPETQYTAASFAQPLRRVFGTLVFRAREQVDMPPPGDFRPARLTVTMIDPAWEAFYAPISGIINWLADRLNALQYLTIRRYLSMVFIALILLLSFVALRG